jgi:hypothetical protein
MRKMLILLIVLPIIPLVISAQQNESDFSFIDFDSPHWDLEGAKVLQYMDRKALAGSAMLKDVEFQNGIIKVDIYATSKKRSYPGVLFRLVSPTDYERVYIRPHRSIFYPDAIQYIPCFNGIDSWQLYNGDGYTSAAEIPADTWFTLTIDVSGDQAKIYLGDASTPSLVIRDLKHGERKGAIGLSGMMGNTAFFSNFRYKIKNDIPANPINVIEKIPGIIIDWELSKPFKELEITTTECLNLDPLKITWQKVSAETTGLLDISRFIPPEEMYPEPLRIYTRKIIHSDREQIKKYLFGYSDIVHIYLNGKLLFSGDSTYRSRDLSFLGVVGLFDAVYLPLKKGDNELIFAVTEQMGGWGLICRDATEILQDSSLTMDWKIEKAFKIPESVAYDPKEKMIYVSNYDGFNRSKKEGLQSISKISLDGKVVDLNWAKGLANPTGLTIFKNMLFAVERSGVAEIELSSGKIVNRFICNKSVMLNDIAVSKNGSIFVSDSGSGCIYRIKDGVSEIWIAADELRGANGLLTNDENIWIVTDGDGCLKEISMESKKISLIANLNATTLDGLQLDAKGNFLISGYDGKLYRVTRAGKITKILDLTGPEINIADFYYDQNNNMILIPTFLDNSLMRYSVR